MLVFFEKKGNFGTAHGNTKNERPLNQVENHAYVLERCHLKQRQGEHKPPNGNDNEEFGKQVKTENKDKIICQYFLKRKATWVRHMATQKMRSPCIRLKTMPMHLKGAIFSSDRVNISHQMAMAMKNLVNKSKLKIMVKFLEKGTPFKVIRQMLGYT